MIRARRFIPGRIVWAKSIMWEENGALSSVKWIRDVKREMSRNKRQVEIRYEGLS